MLGRISFASGSIQIMSDAEQNHTCLGGAEKDLELAILTRLHCLHLRIRNRMGCFEQTCHDQRLQITSCVEFVGLTQLQNGENGLGR